MYGAHVMAMVVFRIISEEDHWMTEWGFADSEHPLIKSEKRFGQWERPGGG